MKSKLKLMTLPLILLSLISGCEFLKQEATPTPDQGGGGITIPLTPERLLSQAERAQAVRVCEAVEEARFRYETYQDREVRMSFDTFLQSCGASEFIENGNYSAWIRKSITGEISLEAPANSGVLTDVLTDRHPLLGDFCKKIFSGAEVSNTQPLLNDQLRFILTSTTSMDGLEVIRYSKNRQGEMVARNGEAYRLHTRRSTSSPELQGLVMERIQALPCTNPSQTRRFRQTLKQVIKAI